VGRKKGHRRRLKLLTGEQLTLPECIYGLPRAGWLIWQKALAGGQDAAAAILGGLAGR